MNEDADSLVNWKRRAQQFEVITVVFAVAAFVGMYFTRRYGEREGLRACGSATSETCHDTFLNHYFWGGSIACPRNDQRIESVVDAGFFCRCERPK
jgi:hypothetical protein